MADEEEAAMLENDDDKERLQPTPMARFSVSRSLPDREENAATEAIRTAGRMVAKHLSRKVAALIATFLFSSFLFALQIEVDGNRSQIANLKESSYENSLAYLLSEMVTMKQDIAKETKERTELAAEIASSSSSSDSATSSSDDPELRVVIEGRSGLAVSPPASLTFHAPYQWGIDEHISSGDGSSDELSRVWAPSTLRVRVGDTVQWTWSTNENVIEATEEFGESTEPLFCSGDLQTAGTFSHKFEKPGVFRFISQNSMGLHGTITVLEETKITSGVDRDGLQINGGIRMLPEHAGDLPTCDAFTVGSIKYVDLSHPANTYGVTDKPPPAEIYFAGLVICRLNALQSPSGLTISNALPRPESFLHGWAPLSWKGDAIFHEGYWYTTMDPSYSSDSSALQVQNYWLQLPVGWEVAPYSESVMQGVGYDHFDISVAPAIELNYRSVSRHHWGTEYLAFAPSGSAAAVYSTLDGSALPDKPDGGAYTYGVCTSITYDASSEWTAKLQYKCVCDQAISGNVDVCPSAFKAKIMIRTDQFSLVHKYLG